MTLRRRLFISNVLMVAVPAISTVAVVLVCVYALWNSALLGAEVDDGTDFQQVGLVVDALADAALSSTGDDRQERFGRLDEFLNDAGMALLIKHDEETVYGHDNSSVQDDALLEAARFLPDGGLIESDGKVLRTSTLQSADVIYSLSLWGAVRPPVQYDTLKAGLVISLLLVLLTVLTSVFLTSRFLSRFLIKRIKRPLEMLEEGLRALSGGDLSYRIVYEGTDEFGPACRDFNIMAGRLEASIEKLHREEEARKQLIADISHDLRSPLTSIKGYAEGILDGVANTPAMRRRYLKTITTKTEEIMKLVNNLFEFSKLGLEEYPVRLELMRIDIEVDQVVQGYRGESGARSDYRLSLLPVSAYADRDLLARTLTNIFDNSEKYGGDDGASIQVVVGDEGGECFIEIADQGSAVSIEEARSLFDVFYRTDEARQETEKGSGIGLAFVKRAMDLMGGSVSAKPNEPKGLVVTMTLPKEEFFDGTGNTDH